MGGHVPAGTAKMIAGIVAQIADRRPSDMSDAELEALPTGPYIQHERPVTREDWDQSIRGRTVVTVEYLPLKITAVRPGDIFAWRDNQGRVWDFGQWADGRWFKQSSALA